MTHLQVYSWRELVHILEDKFWKLMPMKMVLDFLACTISSTNNWIKFMWKLNPDHGKSFVESSKFELSNAAPSATLCSSLIPGKRSKTTDINIFDHRPDSTIPGLMIQHSHELALQVDLLLALPKHPPRHEFEFLPPVPVAQQHQHTGDEVCISGPPEAGLLLPAAKTRSV